MANPRNVFFPVSGSQQLNTTSFLVTILQLKYNDGATGIATVESSSLSVMRLGWLKTGTVGLQAENFHF